MNIPGSTMKYVIFLLLLATLHSGCRSVNPGRAFDPQKTPQRPDFARLDHWAAHPDKKDPADRTPQGLQDEQATAEVDVFFIHPTIYLGTRRGENNWNASLDDTRLNAETDSSTILFQASIFNGAGRIFAPRYRQAHVNAFHSNDQVSNQRALDTAYADVQAAFEYYLKNWNRGRPFIIAAHSQGAVHAKTLLRNVLENKPLQQKLVAAYIVGWRVERDFFKRLPACTTPEQTGCYCSWRTWKKNYGRRKADEPNSVCTNPLTWTITEGQYAPKSANRGGVLRPFGVLRPGITDAEVWRGYLLADKPKFPGSILFIRRNYHIADFNLYYLNVRENAQARAAAFFKK